MFRSNFAKVLHDQGVVAVGADNSGLEVSPTTIPGDPMPVHRFLIQEKGISHPRVGFISKRSRTIKPTFLFICLPLTVRGATGSMVRPPAIV